MNNYKKFSTQDFILDTYFREWVLGKVPHGDFFWENWIQDNPEKTQLIEDAKSLIIALQVKESNVFTPHEIEEGMQKILNDTILPKERGKVNMWPWVRIAASILIFIGIGWWFFRSNIQASDTEGKTAIHTNKTTKAISFKLADGSSIILEPNSELRYGNDFGKTKREVFLVGEAFFDVKKDSERPFLIYTETVVTKVVGTSFRIKAYKEAEKISIDVNTGKVTVYKQDAATNIISSQIVLVPNQKAVFEKKEEQFIKTLVERPIVVQSLPQNSSLDFKETKIPEVITIIERMYGVKISFDKEAFTKCTLTGNITNETLYQKLELICEIIQARYEIVDGEIFIYGKGC